MTRPSVIFFYKDGEGTGSGWVDETDFLAGRCEVFKNKTLVRIEGVDDTIVNEYLKINPTYDGYGLINTLYKSDSLSNVENYKKAMMIIYTKGLMFFVLSAALYERDWEKRVKISDIVYDKTLIEYIEELRNKNASATEITRVERIYKETPYGLIAF